MSKQKTKTVDMSIKPEDLDDIVLPEEAMEQKHLKELKYQEKLAKRAKKAAKEEEKEEIQEKIEAKVEENVTEGKKPKVSTKVRSKRYVASRRLVDRTKTYSVKQTCELVTKTSYSKFPGTVVADLVTKDAKISAEVRFPHSTGKTLRVAVATEDLLKDIEAGKLEFDILVTKPQMMPKLAKFAKVLGPKGLMPNPKNKTIVDDPEKRQKELASGKVTVKTEKKSPLMHVVIGKTDLKAKKLEENLDTLIKAIGGRKILKLVLSATMSPGIKVDLTPYQAI
jgi:large subunit ribosomal protein L1